MTVSEWKPLSYRYDPAGRKPILEAAQVTIEAYKIKDASIGHDLPPRMGKSTLIQILAIEFQALNAPFVHVLAPWVSLAQQLVNSTKVKQNLTRSVAEGWTGPFIGHAIDSISTARYWQRKNAPPFSLLSSTIHLAATNRDIVERAIRLACEETGRRPVIIVDEVHLVALGQRWWDILLSFQTAGAFIVTMTGTSGRADDICILGFRQVPIGEWIKKNQKVVVFRGESYVNDEDGQLVRDIKVEDRQIQERQIITEATGITVPWQVSFENRWMHSVSAEPIDFRVVLDGKPVYISEVEKSVARRNLGQWVRSEECCRALAKQAVKALSDWRSKEETRHTKVLVVTAPDKDNEDDKPDEKRANVHARTMRRQIESFLLEDPRLAEQELSIEICTSVNEFGEPDEKAAEKIRRFGLIKPDKDGSQPIDILIVKGMGLVGLDVPECKILVDASTIRVGPLKKQLATRPLTVWRVSEEDAAPEAQIFYPQDPDNFDFYSSLCITSAYSKEKSIESADQEERVAPVKEKDPYLLLVDSSGEKGGYHDEGGKWLRGDYDDLLRKIYHRWPETRVMRKIALIELYKNGAFPDSEMPADIQEQRTNTPRFIDLGEQLKEERNDSFGSKAKRFTSQLVDYGQEPDKWREVLRTLQSQAKRACNVSPDEPVDKIQDPDKLRELKKALERKFTEMQEKMKRD